jgi:hypothetical protein
MRDAEEYDGKGCYNGICVPECEYYVPEIDEEARRELRRSSSSRFNCNKAQDSQMLSRCDEREMQETTVATRKLETKFPKRKKE